MAGKMYGDDLREIPMTTEQSSKERLTEIKKSVETYRRQKEKLRPEVREMRYDHEMEKVIPWFIEQLKRHREVVEAAKKLRHIDERPWAGITQVSTTLAIKLWEALDALDVKEKE